MVLPNNRKDKYDSVKKYLCVDCPVSSQCVISRTLSRPHTLMTVATKIAMQMVCKMGGELWSVEIPVSIVYTMLDSLNRSRGVLWSSFQMVSAVLCLGAD